MLPKTHLHLHLTGAMRAATMRELAVLGLWDRRLAVLAGHSIASSAAPAALREELLDGVRGWLGDVTAGAPGPRSR